MNQAVIAMLYVLLVPAVAAQQAPAQPAVKQAQATPADARFVSRALAAGEAELAAARVAIIKGEAELVRKFGRDVIVDRTAANEELKRIAAAHNIKPGPVEPAHQGARSPAPAPSPAAQAARLERLSGAAFDREYLKLGRQENARLLQLYEEQARTGSGALRNFAEVALIRLREQEKLLDVLAGG